MIQTTFDNDPSIATPATVKPSLTTNLSILKENPIIIPYTQQEVKKNERKRRSQKNMKEKGNLKRTQLFYARHTLTHLKNRVLSVRKCIFINDKIVILYFKSY